MLPKRAIMRNTSDLDDPQTQGLARLSQRVEDYRYKYGKPSQRLRGPPTNPLATSSNYHAFLQQCRSSSVSIGRPIASQLSTGTVNQFTLRQKN